MRRRREVYLEVGANCFDTAPDGVDALAEFAAFFRFADKIKYLIR